METILMKALESFKKLLAQETQYLSDLVMLEDDKYEALKQVEVSSLMKINSLEEEKLHCLGTVEKKRKEIILGLAEILPFDSNSTLTELLKIIPDEGFEVLKDELTGLRLKIKVLSDKLQVTLKENSEMIKTNLEIINVTLNFANRNSQRETYGYKDRKETRESIYLVNQIA